MKKTHFLFLIALVYLCTGCIGNLINPDKLINGTMSCKVDGQSWAANEASGVNVFGTISITGLNGTSKNGSTILLSIDKEKAKVGTTIDLTDSNLLTSALSSYGTTTNGVDNFYVVSTGNVKITAANGSKLEGTFSFEADDLTGNNKTISVENGKFSINVLL